MPDLTLYWAPSSPFVRKVMVAAHELGMADRLTLIEVTVENIVDLVSPVNPLAQIPTLVIEDDTVLYDSTQIVAWLDERFGGSLGGNAENRWRVAARAMAATGLMEASVLQRNMGAQPEGEQPTTFIARLQARRARTLDHLQETLGDAADPVTTDVIATACALAYQDFRFAHEDWRARRPALADWFATFSERPSMQATTAP